MIGSFLAQFAVQLPVLAVLAVGVLVSLANRERLGRAANLAMAGFIILSIQHLMGFATNLLIPYFYSLDMNTAQIGVAFAVFGFVLAIIAAVGFGCLIMALLRARS